MNKGYDVVGDIHGHVKELHALLDRLGYKQTGVIWASQTERKLIFVGDLIDKGPSSREVVQTVRSLCDQNLAICIMGNHEYNALCFHNLDLKGRPLRSVIKRSNREQHKATLDSYEGFEDQFYDDLNWFLTLPLFWEEEGLRVVHACWQSELIQNYLEHYGTNKIETQERLRELATKGTWQYDFIESVLKGLEVELPKGTSFKDKYGKTRTMTRLNWWAQGEAYGEVTEVRNLSPENLEGSDHQSLLNQVVDESSLYTYCPEEPLVIFGHYWQSKKQVDGGEIRNALCVDFSVADDKRTPQDRHLAAYCWSGERQFNLGNLIAVEFSS